MERHNTSKVTQNYTKHFATLCYYHMAKTDGDDNTQKTYHYYDIYAQNC